MRLVAESVFLHVAATTRNATQISFGPFSSLPLFSPSAYGINALAPSDLSTSSQTTMIELLRIAPVMPRGPYDRCLSTCTYCIEVFLCCNSGRGLQVILRIALLLLLQSANPSGLGGLLLPLQLHLLLFELLLLHPETLLAVS